MRFPDQISSFFFTSNVLMLMFLPMRSMVNSSAATSKQLMLFRGTCCNFNTRGNKSPSVSPKVLSLKVHAQLGPLETNGRALNLLSPKESREHKSEKAKISKQLPIWHIIIVNIIKTVLSRNSMRSFEIVDPFQGNLVQEGLVFRQNFSIRSYQIDTDCKASIGAIMKILQDTALNHIRAMGLLADGFGSSPEMSKRNLIWVFSRMEIVVDRYPTWGDVVQVDKWMCASGKNQLRLDWLLLDHKTGERLIRASSMLVMMNKKTRRLSKFIEEAKKELRPYLRDCAPIINQDGKRLPRFEVNEADNVQKGLTPVWDDLDVNVHVNNAKYMAWILESAPRSIVESCELSSVTLEYQKECGIDSVLQSLTTVVRNSSNIEETEMQHLLRLETGQEVVRGRTTWRPKQSQNINFFDAENLHAPSEQTLDSETI